MDKSTEQSTSQSKNNGALGGFLMGAAIGALGGLLLAPRSGRETRQQLQDTLANLTTLSESLRFDLQSQTERLSDQALQQWEGTLNRLREAIAAGIEASQEEARNQAHQAAHQDTITVPAESADNAAIDLHTAPNMAKLDSDPQFSDPRP